MPSAETGPATGVVVCADLGSTFTKGLLVDLDSGDVLASASSRTTVGSDVMDGFDAVVAALAAQDPRAADAPARACSSAGGGLRIAVVGNEALVTAEAGRRVALSSGGRVVAVLALSGHGTEGPAPGDLDAAGADVVLLVGGTDGGNPTALLDGSPSRMPPIPLPIHPLL